MEHVLELLEKESQWAHLDQNKLEEIATKMLADLPVMRPLTMDRDNIVKVLRKIYSMGEARGNYARSD